MELQPNVNQPNVNQNQAIRLLRAIYLETGGLDRAVRDVTELETGLTADEARAAWQYLLDEGLIRRFNLAYAARLSIKGMVAIEQLPPEPPPHLASRRIFIARGAGTAALEAVAQFLKEAQFQVILLSDKAEESLMEQAEQHDDVAYAIVLLPAEELPFPPMDTLMELGYLMGRLGRARVRALAADSPVELPADLAGVALERLDSTGAWRTGLTRALQECGLEF